MATKTEFDWSSGFDRAGQSSERTRERLLQAQLQQAMQTASGLAGRMGELFERLPEALLKAQQKELQRRQARHGEADPRAAELRGLMEATQQMRATAQRVRERASRIVEASTGSTWMLHGYVSRLGDLEPVANVDVVLANADGRSELRVRTDETGYFRFVPDAKFDRRRAASAPRAEADPQKLVAGDGTAAPADAAASRMLATLQIRTRDGKTLHVEPVPVLLDGEGVVYREIVIDEAQRLSPEQARGFWQGWR